MSALKTISLLLTSILVFLSSDWNNKLQAQTTPVKQKYKVQIGAYNSPNISSFNDLHQFGDLYMEQGSGSNVKKVVIGYFDTREDAEKVLALVKSKTSYADAFIGILNIEATGPQTETTVAETKTETKTTAETKEEPAEMTMVSDRTGELEATEQTVADRTTEATEEVVADKTMTGAELTEIKLTYLVKVGVYPTLADLPNLSSIQPLGKMYIDNKGGKHILMLGVFDQKVQANAVLDAVKKEGFNSAKIVSMTTTVDTEKDSDSKPQTMTYSEPAETNVSDNNTAAKEEATETPVSDRQTPQTHSSTTVTSTPVAPPPKATPSSPQPMLDITTSSGQRKIVTDGGAATNVSASTSTASEVAVADRPATMSVTTPGAGSIGSPLATQPGTNQVLKTATQIRSDFNNFNIRFPVQGFSVLAIDPYDPTQEINSHPSVTNSAAWVRNSAFKGSKLADELIYLFDSALSPNGNPLSFYALQKFALDGNHDAYVIRTGTGSYNIDNNIYLYVFNKTLGQFTAKEELSSVMGGGATPFAKKQSWLRDLNGDNIPDIVSYAAKEFYTSDGQFHKSDEMTSKIWVNGQFVPSQLTDETRLKTELGIQ